MGVALIVVVACGDDGITQTTPHDGSPAATASPSPTETSPSPMAPTAGVIGPDLAEFGEELIRALDRADVQRVLDLSRLRTIECIEWEGIGSAPGCDGGAGTSDPYIPFRVLQSHGFPADEEEYRRLVLEYATNLADEGDEFGGPAPTIYAAGKIGPPVGDWESVYLLITRISGEREETGGFPGPPLSRQALFVGVSAGSQPMMVEELILAPLNLYDAEGSGSIEAVASGLYSSWELWPVGDAP